LPSFSKKLKGDRNRKGFLLRAPDLVRSLAPLVVYIIIPIASGVVTPLYKILTFFA